MRHVALLAHVHAQQHLVVKKFYLVALLLNHALQPLAAAAQAAAALAVLLTAEAIADAEAVADAVAAVKNVAGGRFSKTKTAVTNATNAVTAATN